MRLSPRDVTGVILAGGRATRMGGGNKGLIPFGAETLIARVIRRVQPQVGAMAINANCDPAVLATFSLPVIPDDFAGQPGPLAGLLAGLRWTAETVPAARFMLSVPADAPFLPLDLVERLAQGLGENEGRVAIAASGAQTHPVVGLWPVAIADAIGEALEAGERAVYRITDRNGAAVVPFPITSIRGQPADPFFNVNTPEDLAEARHLDDLLDREQGTSRGAVRPPVIAVVGWKGTGKTTLVCRLVSAFARHGVRVATIKHTHHPIDQIDPSPTAGDTGLHRAAGAAATVLVAADGAIVDGAVRPGPAPSLDTALRLAGAANLVIVEGFKMANVPKIEVRRSGGTEGPLLAGADPDVIAIASDQALPDQAVPVLHVDDIDGLIARIKEVVELVPAGSHEGER